MYHAHIGINGNCMISQRFMDFSSMSIWNMVLVSIIKEESFNSYWKFDAYGYSVLCYMDNDIV